MFTKKSFKCSWVVAFVLTVVYVASLSLFTVPGAQAQSSGVSAADLRAFAMRSGTNSLATVKIVDAPNLKQFVVNRVALQQLGKALFWDQQVGSDGQACASCHFHAGADNRSKNQVNPGFRNTIPGVNDTALGPNTAFGVSASNMALGPNYQLVLADFPFGKNTNDIVSSQGVLNAAYSQPVTRPGDAVWPGDWGRFSPNVFMNASVRNVEPRNTPTVINAVLNHRNFWDGRGRNEFNGVNPLGSLEKGFIAKVVPSGAVLVQTGISDSSGASQAVGPPDSDLEMSFAGRRFPEIGRKLLNAKPLAKQTVAVDDSVLGTPAPGVKPFADYATYADLVRAAFDPSWYTPGPTSTTVIDLSTGSPQLVKNGTADQNRFTVMEYNFSLYMGLAVNEYEKMLIANASPFDKFMEGDLNALSASEQNGLKVFLGQGKCINCHGGPEFTNASLANVRGFQILERMIMGNDRVAVYDNGFYNTGVRATGEDLGVGATIGSKNRPLSNSRAFQECLKSTLGGNPSPTPAQHVEANSSCGVPRILARPIEAARLLGKAAVGNAQALFLVTQANRLLTAIPPNLVLGSCALAKNAVLACPTTTTQAGIDPTGAPVYVTTQNNGALDVLRAAGTADAQLLAGAVSLLPDQSAPGVAPDLLAPVLSAIERVAVDGAFKTPTVRNSELTAPYFHNGGTATLKQMVEFYNRGGDFPVENNANLDPDIQPLGLSDGQIADLVAFIKATTDDRVRFDRAPFDHPSLNIPNGGGSTYSYMIDGHSVMDDRIVLPAVGGPGLLLGQKLGNANTPFANFLDPLK